jgi:hypothetical protein
MKKIFVPGIKETFSNFVTTGHENRGTAIFSADVGEHGDVRHVIVQFPADLTPSHAREYKKNHDSNKTLLRQEATSFLFFPVMWVMSEHAGVRT